MGVQDQDLRSLSQWNVHRSLPQHRGVQPQVGPVIDIDSLVVEVLPPLFALRRHLQDALVLCGRLQVGFLLLLLIHQFFL